MILLFIVILAISLGIFAVFVAVTTITIKRAWFSSRKKKTYRHKQIYEIRTNHQNKNGKFYSPTGWTFNEETKLWEPPDYLIKQSKEKWEWDEEKRIWIDKEKDRK